MNEREMMELRLALAVVIVLIVAIFTVRGVWSGSTSPELSRGVPAATSDAAAAARSMTFTQPNASSK